MRIFTNQTALFIAFAGKIDYTEINKAAALRWTAAKWIKEIFAYGTRLP